MYCYIRKRQMRDKNGVQCLHMSVLQRPALSVMMKLLNENGTSFHCALREVAITASVVLDSKLLLFTFTKKKDHYLCLSRCVFSSQFMFLKHCHSMTEYGTLFCKMLSGSFQLNSSMTEWRGFDAWAHKTPLRPNLWLKMNWCLTQRTHWEAFNFWVFLHCDDFCKMIGPSCTIRMLFKCQVFSLCPSVTWK